MRLRINDPIVIDTRQKPIRTCPVDVVKNGVMYAGLIALMIRVSPNGSEIRIAADIRPIEVSAFTFRACRWRSRTVSESVSKSPASEPPTCDWTLTAVATYSRSAEPMRSHMPVRAWSSGRPSRSSPSTRLNSSEAGGLPSSAIARIAGRSPCPARSVEAIVESTSGSCRSNAFLRRAAASRRTSSGTPSPSSMARMASSGLAPRTVTATPKTRADRPAR